MNHTIEGSKKFEVVCFGWVEDLEKLENKKKGLTVEKSARKNGKESNPENIQEIQVGKIGNAKLLKNGTLELDNGTRIDKFAKYEDIAKLKENRKTKSLDMGR